MSMPSQLDCPPQWLPPNCSLPQGSQKYMYFLQSLRSTKLVQPSERVCATKHVICCLILPHLLPSPFLPFPSSAFPDLRDNRFEEISRSWQTPPPFPHGFVRMTSSQCQKGVCYHWGRTGNIFVYFWRGLSLACERDVNKQVWLHCLKWHFDVERGTKREARETGRSR